MAPARAARKKRGADAARSQGSARTRSGSSLLARQETERTTTARRPEETKRRQPLSTSHWAEVSGHRQELVVLVLVAFAVFLVVVIVAANLGGVLGRAVATGLRYVLGNLALLVPLGLLALAGGLLLQKKLVRASWFAGGCVLLFGVLLLVAAGGVPFGGHGASYFVRTEFELRAGVVGEALYAGFHELAGTLGVALIGWVAALAGLTLATGMSLRRAAAHTKQMAETVRRAADAYRSGGGSVSYLEDWAAVGRGPRVSADGAKPPLGPIDLVGGGDSDQETWDFSTGRPSPFGGEFDEWEAAGPGAAQGRSAGGTIAVPSSAAVIDGAQAFRDLYETPARATTAAPPPGAAAGSASRGATGPEKTGQSFTASPQAAESAVGGGATEEEHEVIGRQPALPGVESSPLVQGSAAAEPTYVMPDADWLKKSVPQPLAQMGSEKDKGAVIVQTLSQFGVEARVIGKVVGPRVTRYELQLAPGIKVARVASLKDDLAYALATTEIRILTPIPGKSAVGVEVPNQHADFVTLGDIYRDFPKSAGPLMVWLGKDISGKAVYTDLTQLPHLLIAGTTGSGKSGCVNCIVSSILLRATPGQVRFVMIDPKKVELSHYDRIPHLLVPVVTNMKDAAGVLHNLLEEMEDRYELMELEHSRSLADMNKARARRGERPLPYIVVVIDELADLMMVSPQEVEDYVIRLAQKARAVGIHLVVATQRPSADVITGMIKANIPSRIAFFVSSQTDSRVILDMNGAETLLGRGDMLFKPLGSSHLQRIQGAYITEEEIAVLVNHWRRQAEPEFREELLRRPPDVKEQKRGEDELFDPDSDDLLADAAQLVIETGSASVSMLQRRLRVGYTRAGRLIDILERRGIVGPWEGSKPRQILVEPEEVESVLSALRAESRNAARDDRTYSD